MEIYKGESSPILLEVDNTKSSECLCFYKTINNDGVHGYIKTLGVYKKLELMEASWSNLNGDPIRTPDFWTYSLNLDELLKTI